MADCELVQGSRQLALHPSVINHISRYPSIDGLTDQLKLKVDIMQTGSNLKALNLSHEGYPSNSAEEVQIFQDIFKALTLNGVLLGFLGYFATQILEGWVLNIGQRDCENRT